MSDIAMDHQEAIPDGPSTASGEEASSEEDIPDGPFAGIKPKQRQAILARRLERRTTRAEKGPIRLKLARDIEEAQHAINALSVQANNNRTTFEIMHFGYSTEEYADSEEATENVQVSRRVWKTDATYHQSLVNSHKADIDHLLAENARLSAENSRLRASMCLFLGQQ